MNRKATRIKRFYKGIPGVLILITKDQAIFVPDKRRIK
jgi:hypothetical protein